MFLIESNLVKTVLHIAETVVPFHYPKIFYFAIRLYFHWIFGCNLSVKMKNIAGHDPKIHLVAIFENYE